jgi:hypothetical protein
MGAVVEEPKPSNCVTAEEVRQAYVSLGESRVCNNGQSCLRDECYYCEPLLRLIEQRGDECLERGCTLRRCVYDAVPV